MTQQARTTRSTAQQPKPDEPAVTDEAIAAALSTDQWIYLALGPNVWGKGFTEDQAIQAMRASYYGHAPARGMAFVIIAAADPWATINGMGDVCYTPRPEFGPRDQPATASTREWIEVRRHTPARRTSRS